MSLLSLLLFATPATAAQVQATVNCEPAAKMINALEELGLQPIAGGMSLGGDGYILWRGEGLWQVTRLLPDGRLCTMGSGFNWHSFRPTGEMS